METKATQEPWLRDGLSIFDLQVITDERGKEVRVNRFWASVQAGRPSPSTEELLAIARLMHAAPELLAALIECEKRLRHIAKFYGDTALLKTTRKAIARATGQDDSELPSEKEQSNEHNR